MATLTIRLAHAESQIWFMNRESIHLGIGLWNRFISFFLFDVDSRPPPTSRSLLSSLATSWLVHWTRVFTLRLRFLLFSQLLCVFSSFFNVSCFGARKELPFHLIAIPHRIHWILLLIKILDIKSLFFLNSCHLIWLVSRYVVLVSWWSSIVSIIKLGGSPMFL